MVSLPCSNPLQTAVPRELNDESGVGVYRALFATALPAPRSGDFGALSNGNPHPDSLRTLSCYL